MKKRSRLERMNGKSSRRKGTFHTVPLYSIHKTDADVDYRLFRDSLYPKFDVWGSLEDFLIQAERNRFWNIHFHDGVFLRGNLAMEMRQIGYSNELPLWVMT